MLAARMGFSGSFDAWPLCMSRSTKRALLSCISLRLHYGTAHARATQAADACIGVSFIRAAWQSDADVTLHLKVPSLVPDKRVDHLRVKKSPCT